MCCVGGMRDRLLLIVRHMLAAATAIRRTRPSAVVLSISGQKASSMLEANVREMMVSSSEMVATWEGRLQMNREAQAHKSVQAGTENAKSPGVRGGACGYHRE